ncbi:MAG TPA: DUF6457 domain-containing protein [Gaiellaceae bacterium]|nr:DUF6457 domain-containing protein [Gaiellaceae bacterium]
MDPWLSEARDRIAERAGISPAELDLDADTEATLLDLARVAAHESGARTNAPLRCYLAGRVAWRECSRGRPRDYSEISYDRLRGGSGVQWGGERLYTDGRFPTEPDDLQ